jgi:hypothetical protein
VHRCRVFLLSRRTCHPRRLRVQQHGEVHQVRTVAPRSLYALYALRVAFRHDPQLVVKLLCLLSDWPHVPTGIVPNARISGRGHQKSERKSIHFIHIANQSSYFRTTEDIDGTPRCREEVPGSTTQ